MANEKIKIMWVISRMNVGGPAIQIALLTARLNNSNFESRLVCGSIEEGEGDMMYYAESLGVAPTVIPELSRSLNPLRDIRTLWQIYKVMREYKPDIVHTHTSKAGFLGRWAAWFAGVPVILHTFHGHVFAGYFSERSTRLFIWLERITAKISDMLITLTQSLRGELVDVYRVAKKEHITVLPLGLDLHAFSMTPRMSGKFREEWNIPANVPLVGITGRFVPIKNHALFVEAAKLVHDIRPEVMFVMIGDGELREDVERQIDMLGLRGIVKITGWMRDVAPAYADMNVFVISSISEGTPVTVIEALATGTPVVCTQVGGMHDLLDGGELGRLVPSGDAQALAKAIIETIDNPPTNSEKAQLAMLDRYGIDRLVSDLDSLYRGLLARKRG